MKRKSSGSESAETGWYRDSVQKAFSTKSQTQMKRAAARIITRSSAAQMSTELSWNWWVFYHGPLSPLPVDTHSKTQLPGSIFIIPRDTVYVIDIWHSENEARIGQSGRIPLFLVSFFLFFFLVGKKLISQFTGMERIWVLYGSSRSSVLTNCFQYTQAESASKSGLCNWVLTWVLCVLMLPLQHFAIPVK